MATASTVSINTLPPGLDILGVLPSAAFDLFCPFTKPTKNPLEICKKIFDKMLDNV
jgi:hypothetical protein